jgi:hypothetical protein
MRESTVAFATSWEIEWITSLAALPSDGTITFMPDADVEEGPTSRFINGWRDKDGCPALVCNFAGKLDST